MSWRDRLPSRLRRPVDAYLSLGSNVGDRAETLRAAIVELDRADDVEVTAVSGVYETDPVGGVDQDPFYNLAVAVRTTRTPHELLDLAHELEAAHGRDRASEVRWGPRTLDVDLILFGDRVVDDEQLTVPHPRMHERAFVLVPLLEVHPGGTLPDGTRLSTLVARLAPVEGVALAFRLTELPWSGLPRPPGPRGAGAFLADEWDRSGGPPDEDVYR